MEKFYALTGRLGQIIENGEIFTSDGEIQQVWKYVVFYVSIWIKKTVYHYICICFGMMVLNNWIKSFLHCMRIEMIGQNFKFSIVISFRKLNLRVFPVAYDLQGSLEMGLISS